LAPMSLFLESVKKVASHVAEDAKGAAKHISSELDFLPKLGKADLKKLYRDPNILPTRDYLGLSRGKLKFRFGGGGNSGHWVVLIYHNSVHDRETVDVLHYIPPGCVGVGSRAFQQGAIDYKEHTILLRNYVEIIEWCLNYQNKFGEYSYSHVNCRRFVIRLAEFCGVGILEIDGQKSLHVPVSSQYYTVRDGAKNGVDSAKDVAKGNLLSGVTKLGVAVIKMPVQIAVSSGRTLVSLGKEGVSKSCKALQDNTEE